MEHILKNKINKLIFSFLAALGCAYMVSFPTHALESTKEGVSLWVNSVLPALLPFFICSNFLVSLGVPSAIGKLFERPCRLFFGVSGKASFIFLSSIISGYPMGPKLIGDLYEAGQLSRKESKRILTFSTTSGPLFLIGVVGTVMLGSPALGIIVAIGHYVGAILNGILFRLLGGNAESDRGSAIIQSEVNSGQKSILLSDEQSPSLLELFTKAITSSFVTLGIICGYIVIFTIITDFIQVSGLLNFLAIPASLRKIRLFEFISNYELRLFVVGLLEMTVGCNGFASAMGITLFRKLVVCTFFVSFGGLSVMAQSLSVLKGCKISPIYYLAVKLSHGIISGILVYFLGSIYMKYYLLGLSTHVWGLF